METINEINQEVLKLWEHTFDNDSEVFMPLIYLPIKKRILLFVGLNPSFSLKGFRIILKDTPYLHLNPEEFFHWRNRAKFDLETAQTIEALARSKYTFFDKFRDIARYTATEWEHIDLFFYRQTGQNDFKRRIYSAGVLSEFARKQLELSKGLIVEVCPKAIVVANAHASKLFSQEFKTKFDEEQGCHMIRLNDQVVPVFLASMLTGQRAMDVYSYERFRWHIKKVLADVKRD
jgi:hypothetical protein